jgi:hypothetical protein
MVNARLLLEWIERQPSAMRLEPTSAESVIIPDLSHHSDDE